MSRTDSDYKRAQVTYAQLHRALSLLGVSRRPVENDPDVNVYEHAASGPLIALAAYPESDRVVDYHLAALRTVLANFGIADPTAFDAELQKAG